MLFMNFNNTFIQKIIPYSLIVVIVYLSISCIVIGYLAATGDTTLLGDPFYEDGIMAQQRAFVPWAFTWIIVGLSVIMAIVERLAHKYGA